MALNYKQTKLVKDTVPALREHGERIASIFYKNMLRAHPELNNYFNGVNLKNGRQPRALTAVILGFAANINNLAEQIPKFERMCNKHCSLSIRPEHYEIVGEYLIRAYAEVLGPAMTPEVQVAWERAYSMLAKMLIGREAQLYKQFGSWSSWRKFRVDKVVPESADIYSFYLVPQDGKPLPSFLPGQYVSVQVPMPDGYLQARQYSLSEAWRPDYYRISVKRDEGPAYANAVSKSYLHPGAVSNLLIDSVAGAAVDVSHPAGEFFLDTKETGMRPLVLISAGVGVAPMVSIANAVTRSQPGRPISWIHGSRSEQVPFRDHVAQLRAQHPASFRTAVFKSRVVEGIDVPGVTYDFASRVDLARLSPDEDRLFLKHGGTEYFVCGPEAFMHDVSLYLRAQGVAAAHIKIETFSTGDAALEQK
ncbi:globin-like protein [Lasiosphaeria miniovina]|uniref:nitric oxide dioxygenase n=1 Tax=Lasiosphaeria miniovina TaxID=1954250 RepID=A0AA40BH82_9PEZI|nr:globin-like protein [Lasiosphaeria miniovina]KAK0734188.1 globin-like protein [Lasiosphaeria miniovina]